MEQDHATAAAEHLAGIPAGRPTVLDRDAHRGHSLHAVRPRVQSHGPRKGGLPNRPSGAGVTRTQRLGNRRGRRLPRGPEAVAGLPIIYRAVTMIDRRQRQFFLRAGTLTRAAAVSFALGCFPCWPPSVSSLAGSRLPDAGSPSSLWGLSATAASSGGVGFRRWPDR